MKTIAATQTVYTYSIGGNKSTFISIHVNKCSLIPLLSSARTRVGSAALDV